MILITMDGTIVFVEDTTSFIIEMFISLDTGDTSTKYLCIGF